MTSLSKFEHHERASIGVMTIGIVLILAIGIALVALSGGFIGSDTTQEKPETATPPSTTSKKVFDTSTRTDTVSPTGIPTKTSISQTATYTPTKTPTLSPTPRSTNTGTPGPYADSNYGDFVSALLGEAEVDAEVPIYIRGWTVLEGGRLIFALDLTDKSVNDTHRARQVNTFVSGGYSQAVFYYDSGKIDGKIPKKLVIAEINNTNTPSKTLYVNTSLARDYYSKQITAAEFSNRYWETERNMTAKERDYIRYLDKTAGNSTLHNESAN